MKPYIFDKGYPEHVTSGCSRISAGCKNCSVPEQTDKMLQINPFGQLLEEPIIELENTAMFWLAHMENPMVVRLNMHSDLFHDKIPLSYVQQTFKRMDQLSDHKYVIQTKRSRNLLQHSDALNWHDNIWMGVIVENNTTKYRIDHLKASGAKHKLISFDPLLGPIGTVDLRGIDLVIVGGETGRSARPLAEEWVNEIKHQCKQQKVPFYFHKWIDPKTNKVTTNFNGKYYKKLPL